MQSAEKPPKRMSNAHLFKALTCAVLALPIHAGAQQSITLTAQTDTFRANQTAQATVLKKGPFLEVHLARHAVWASKRHKGESEIVSYSVGIATQNEQGQWETARESAEVETNFRLQPGKTKHLKAETLLIPIDGIKKLDKHWIVLILKLRYDTSPTGFAYTYAHSEQLQPTP
jgi:hypothetical protein